MTTPQDIATATEWVKGPPTEAGLYWLILCRWDSVEVGSWSGPTYPYVSLASQPLGVLVLDVLYHMPLSPPSKMPGELSEPSG